MSSSNGCEMYEKVGDLYVLRDHKRFDRNKTIAEASTTAVLEVMDKSMLQERIRIMREYLAPLAIFSNREHAKTFGSSELLAGAINLDIGMVGSHMTEPVVCRDDLGNLDKLPRDIVHASMNRDWMERCGVVDRSLKLEHRDRIAALEHEWATNPAYAPLEVDLEELTGIGQFALAAA